MGERKESKKIGYRKILWIILLAQIAGLLGVFGLRIEMNLMTNKYSSYQKDSYEQLADMNDMRALMYQHESMIYEYIVKEDRRQATSYEIQTQDIKKKFNRKLSEIGERMGEEATEEEKSAYEELTYDLNAYTNSTSIILDISMNNSFEVARYFMVHKMEGYVSNANDGVDKMTKIVEESLASNELQMKRIKKYYTRNFFVIVVFMLVSFLFCFRQCRKLLKLKDSYMAEADKANQAKSEFLSKMSHEIRTPINAVLGMNEMITRECKDEQILEYANNIQISGKTLLGLINDILDVSKIEAGKINLVEVNYEFLPMITDMTNMIQPKAKDKGLEFVTNIDQRIPAIMYGDDLRIRQIIINILTNGVKYTQTGSVALTVGFEKKDESTVCLLVSVKDTGMGMKAEDMEKFSKPFERLDEEKNRNVEGTGLGMNITTNLLKLMHSELKVESVYGEGSCFSFVLEQKVVDWKPISDCAQKQVSQDAENVLIAPDKTVLVVDDVAMNQAVVKALLKRTQIQVDVASSGMECLELIKQKRYDCILMDHMMPEMDGVETLEKVREYEQDGPHIPVIALTANALSGQEVFYKEHGFDGYLTKPIQGAMLEKALRDIFI